MPVRVVFGDDEIPSYCDKQNKRARAEIIRERRSTHPNVEAEYDQDEIWFRGLLTYLQEREGFTLIRAKTIAEAGNQLRKRKDYDIAVIDISWLGDPAFSSEAKKDAGLGLLRQIADANRESTDHKPAIAFSQNWDNELVDKVRATGAFPIQKNDTESGQRLLGAAIRLLADPVQGPLIQRRAGDVTGAEFLRMIGGLTLGQFSSLVGGIVAIITVIFYLGYKFGHLFWH